VLWFALALLLFGLFTLIAHRQAPRPDPFQPVQTLSWDWWQYPLERNAFKRLPVITSDLNDVFAPCVLHEALASRLLSMYIAQDAIL